MGAHKWTELPRGRVPHVQLSVGSRALLFVHKYGLNGGPSDRIAFHRIERFVENRLQVHVHLLTCRLVWRCPGFQELLELADGVVRLFGETLVRIQMGEDSVSVEPLEDTVYATLRGAKSSLIPERHS